MTENGIMVGLLPYTLNKYPSGFQLYSWNVLLTLLFRPFFSFLAYVTTFYNFYIFNLIWICITLFQITITMFYPNIILKDSLFFGILTLILIMFGNCLMTFIKSKEFIISHQKIERVINGNGVIQKILNIEPFRIVGNKILILGFSIQFGSFFGSVSTLIVANFYLERNKNYF
jgi:hypothetical protein